MLNINKKLNFCNIFALFASICFIVGVIQIYSVKKSNEYVSLEDLKEFTDSNFCYKTEVINKIKRHEYIYESVIDSELYKGGITYLDLDIIKKSCNRKFLAEEDKKIMKKQLEAIQK
jgi:hypothetical protein